MAVNETQKHKDRQAVDLSGVYGNSSRGGVSLFAPSRLENSLGDMDQKGYDDSSLFASDEPYSPIIWGDISLENGVNMIIDADADQKFAEMYIQFKKSATPDQIDVFFRLRKIPRGLYEDEDDSEIDSEDESSYYKIKNNLNKKSNNIVSYVSKIQMLYLPGTVIDMATTGEEVSYPMEGLNDRDSFYIKNFSPGDGVSPSIVTTMVDGEEWFFEIYPNSERVIGRYSIETYSNAESIIRKNSFVKSFSEWFYKKSFVTTDDGDYISPIVNVRNKYEKGLISQEKYKATVGFWESASRGDIQIDGANYRQLSAQIKLYMFKYFKENYSLSDVDARKEVDRNFSEENELVRSSSTGVKSLMQFFNPDGFKDIDKIAFQDTLMVGKANTVDTYSGLEPAKNLEFLSYYFKIGSFGDDMQIFFSDSDSLGKINMFFYYWSGVDRKAIRVDVGEIPSPRGFLILDLSVNNKLTNSQSIAFNFEKSGLNSAEADMIISQSIFAGPSLVKERDKNASLDPNFDADIYINFYFPSANKDWVSKGKITKLIQKRNGGMVGKEYSRKKELMPEELHHHASSYMAHTALVPDVENKMQQLNYELNLLISEIYMKGKTLNDDSAYKIISDDLYDAWFELNNSFGVGLAYHKGKKFTNKNNRLIDKNNEFTQEDVDGWAKIADAFLLQLKLDMRRITRYQVPQDVLNRQLVDQIKNKEWLQAKESYRDLTNSFVQWIRDRSDRVSTGEYIDLSKEVGNKGNIFSLLVEQHNKGRDLIPVKAVFYSEDAYLKNKDGEYLSLDKLAVPMSVYCFYEHGAWKAVNLSSGHPFVVKEESAYVEPSVEFMTKLFDQLGAQEDWGRGKMFYQVPFHTDKRKSVDFNGSWGWDDIIKATGYGFFFAGLLASLILTNGATLPIVLEAIGAMGVITGTAIHLIDGFNSESLTTKSIVADVADILASLMPLANFGWALTAKSLAPTEKLFIPLMLDSGINGVSFILTNEADLNQIISLINEISKGNGDTSAAWQLFGLMTYLMVKNTLSKNTLKYNAKELKSMGFMKRARKGNRKNKGITAIPYKDVPEHIFKD